MTTRYVDPSASGDNDGTSWINAYETLQQGADNAVAGDIVYCRGTETTAAVVDFDTNSGTNAGGFIKFIGCNAAGNVDGTRYIIDCNSGHWNGITHTNTSTVWLENFAVYRSAHTGIANGGDSYGWVFINCAAYNCGEYGWTGSWSLSSTLIRCLVYSNSWGGFASFGANTRWYFCCARDNSDVGFSSLATSQTVIGCIGHNNTNGNFSLTSGHCFQCVSDGTSIGITTTANTSLSASFVLGSRITNNSTAGFNCNSEPFVSGWCYFEDNADNHTNDTIHYVINEEGGTTASNKEDQADTGEGYVDKGNHDFSTDYTDATDPTLRRTAITIPWT